MARGNAIFADRRALHDNYDFRILSQYETISKMLLSVARQGPFSKFPSLHD